MREFSCSGLEKKLQSETGDSDNEAQETYAKILNLIKDEFMKHDKYKESIDWHMKEVNNYLTKVYFRFDALENKFKNEGIDQKLNAKLKALQESDFEKMLEIPQNMKKHSIWKKAIKELDNFRRKVTPQGKLESIVKWMTTISRAYLLLSDYWDEVTADDILQFTWYVLLKSNIKFVNSWIRYIRAFA